MDDQIVVEYRPNLRACHFFIKATFAEDTTDIVIQNNSVFILDGNTKLEMKFPGLLEHVVDSLSGLYFTKNSLCFRTRTSPEKQFGSFEREVILHKKEESMDSFMPPFQVNKPIKLYCSDCLFPLTKDYVYFERLLPLPLGTDNENFFCHSNVSAENYLVPRLHDCLYCLYFFKLNPALFEIEISDDIFECPNCNSWLGKVSTNYVQLWNSTTIAGDCAPMASNDVALKDFISAIVEALSEKYSGRKTNKLVLECTTGKRVGGGYFDEYLLIWVMEQNLTIFTYKDLMYESVELKEDNVCKILYLHETSRNETVCDWLDSNATCLVPVSKNMFVKGIEHLNQMSNNIPENFRTTNNMNVSYLRKC